MTFRHSKLRNSFMISPIRCFPFSNINTFGPLPSIIQNALFPVLVEVGKYQKSF